MYRFWYFTVGFLVSISFHNMILENWLQAAASLLVAAISVWGGEVYIKMAFRKSYEDTVGDQYQGN